IPAMTATNTPTKGLPDSTAPIKPKTAPMIIMPSTPRFSTPDRSTTSSPMAASKSGVDATMMLMRMASVMAMRGLRRLSALRQDETDPVEDQRIASEHKEKQQALEHLCGSARHAE